MSFLVVEASLLLLGFMRRSLVYMIAEGDKVITRFTTHGTQQGALGGIPPTGKQVAVSTIEITRIAGGKIVEDWGLDDRLGMLQQLGIVARRGVCLRIQCGNLHESSNMP